MAKSHTRFVCQNCGATQARWAGRCPECGEWNTLVESVAEAKPPSGAARSLSPQAANIARPLPDISNDGQERLPVPMAELSRVLGGGIVPGSVVLVSGDPGIGKSTLLLQLADLMGRDGKVLYASGEESAHQIKLRAQRLDITSPNLYLLSETNLEQILLQIEAVQPRLAIVDSIQSVYSQELDSSPGTVSQVRDCANALLRLAKAQGIPIFIVGHVTKAGSIAGPRVLEHMVDTVLYLEGERFHSFRLLRSVKNRYGSTNEVGVFEMCDRGMVEVANPSQVFLEERPSHATGSAVAVTMEGTRPLLVEIQALVSKSGMERPYRTCNGVDLNRVLLLAAVLTKRVGVRLSDQDIFVNVVGGLRIREPAIDLAIAVAIASSYYNAPVYQDLAIFGEVGLAGELRSVSQTERRLREALKLGFQRGLTPRAHRGQATSSQEITVLSARSLAEAVKLSVERDRGEQREPHPRQEGATRRPDARS
jgi:DNA repair protein RadA/Sms